MYSSNATNSHEVMVVLADGKPVTVIKTKDKSDKIREMGGAGGGRGGVEAITIQDSINMSSVSESQRSMAASAASGRSFNREHDACSMALRFDRDNASKNKEPEDQIELRRLRSENRLLKQRVDNLEKETGSLSNRIVQDQMQYSHQIDELKSKMTSCKTSKTAKEMSQQTENTSLFPADIVVCKHCSHQATNDKNYESVFDINQSDTVMSDLSRREADANATIQQLINKIKELENSQQQPPPADGSDELQRMQDELVACKLREAEATLSFKELQQKVYQLDKHWQQFMQDNQNISTATENKTRNQMDLKEMVMALKIKETYLVSDLSELKQKLMELETENHVYQRQEKRQGVEMEKLQEKISNAELTENEFLNTIKVLEMRLSDLQSKQKEDVMMFKIREAEYCHSAAEMRRRIAELEIENQELLTTAELHNKDQDMKEMENRIQELQEENLQLKSSTNLDSEFNLDIIANCDFSDVMTESFCADTMCLHSSVLLADALPSEAAPDLLANNL